MAMKYTRIETAEALYKMCTGMFILKQVLLT